MKGLITALLLLIVSIECPPDVGDDVFIEEEEEDEGTLDGDADDVT